MGIDETLIQEVVRRVVDVAHPARIVLFGSAASGRMTRDSDVDLLVLERDPGNTRDESVRIRQALRGMGCPFDVIVMRAEYFEETKDIVGGIAFPANKYGRVVYDAA
jgi:predicted nucleotidyltransferase